MSKNIVIVPTGHTLEGVETVPEFYADGVSESLLAVPVSKLMFHSVTGVSEDGKERRIAKVQIAIQTAALLEICRNILAGSVDSAEAIAAGYEHSKTITANILKDVHLTPYVLNADNDSPP